MKDIFIEGDRGSAKSQVAKNLIEPIIPDSSFGADSKTIRCCHCGTIFKVHKDLINPSMLCSYCKKNPWW